MKKLVLLLSLSAVAAFYAGQASACLSAQTPLVSSAKEEAEAKSRVASALKKAPAKSKKSNSSAQGQST